MSEVQDFKPVTFNTPGYYYLSEVLKRNGLRLPVSNGCIWHGLPDSKPTAYGLGVCKKTEVIYLMRMNKKRSGFSSSMYPININNPEQAQVLAVLCRLTGE